MKICIAGWYFRPKFLAKVRDSGYESFIVKHREGDTRGIPSELYENEGLEFGCYRKYVENHWDGASDVLFMHDDSEITDTSGFTSIESLRDMGVEQAYIFQDETHSAANRGVHGRAIWIRGDILKLMATDFPADMGNKGDNVGPRAQSGIYVFHQRTRMLGSNAAVIAIIPQLRLGHRGRINDEMFVYRNPQAEALRA